MGEIMWKKKLPASPAPKPAAKIGSVVEKIAPRVAAEEIPMIPGSARLFLKNIWKHAPLEAKSAPETRARSVRGILREKRIVRETLSFSEKARKNSLQERCFEPFKIEKNIAAKRRISDARIFVRVEVFFSDKLFSQNAVLNQNQSVHNSWTWSAD